MIILEFYPKILLPSPSISLDMIPLEPVTSSKREDSSSIPILPSSLYSRHSREILAPLSPVLDAGSLTNTGPSKIFKIQFWLFMLFKWKIENILLMVKMFLKVVPVVTGAAGKGGDKIKP